MWLECASSQNNAAVTTALLLVFGAILVGQGAGG